MTPAEKIAYINRRMGEPWEIGGLHCWELVRQVQRDVYGREVPTVEGIYALDPKALVRVFMEHEERSRWEQTQWAEDGAIVLMGRGSASSRDIHAGVLIVVEHSGILHVDTPHGIAFDSVAELSAVRGWKPTFFIPRDACRRSSPPQSAISSGTSPTSPSSE